MSSPIAQQPMLFASNPFMDCHDAVWKLLNSKLDFVSLFGTSPNPRQVRMDAQRYSKVNSDLDDLAKAAFPRVRVAVTKLTPMTERDSCSSQCMANFEIQVWTGVQQQRLVLDASWVILRAMVGWRQYVMGNVFWNGDPCVYDVEAEEVTIEWPELEGRGEGQDKRDSKGYEQWISCWSTRVAFFFQTKAMQAI